MVVFFLPCVRIKGTFALAKTAHGADPLGELKQLFLTVW
jgi:hypothetical protein